MKPTVNRLQNGRRIHYYWLWSLSQMGESLPVSMCMDVVQTGRDGKR